MNLHKTPVIVQEAMASKEAAGPIPIIAVFDPRVENMLGIVPYFHMKDVNGFTDVKAALAALRGLPAGSNSMTQHKPETWRNARGRSLEATYITSTSEEVTLRLTNGKSSTVPLSSLSQGSQDRAAELAGE